MKVLLATEMWNNRTDLVFSILTKINSYILQSSLGGFVCLFFVYINKRTLFCSAAFKGH